MSTELCCSPGTYFENGIGTSPATKYAIQRLYSSDFPLYPVYSPPFYDYEHNDTPIMKRDNPRNRGRGRTWSLRGKKNDIWDGGNRVPLIFRWPGKIPPRVNQENVVSLMDIYGTMADILGVERVCYEAPDSRSLWPLLTNQATDITPSSIIHHGLNDATVALRKNQYKWIPEYHQLFNMRLDLGEENNLIGTISKTGHSYTNLAISMNNTLNAMLNTINEREIRQAQGTLKIC